MGNWLDDHDAELLAKAKADIAAEDAAWAALSPQARALILAQREAKFAEVPDADDEEEDDEDEESDDDE